VSLWHSSRWWACFAFMEAGTSATAGARTAMGGGRRSPYDRSRRMPRSKGTSFSWKGRERRTVTWGISGRTCCLRGHDLPAGTAQFGGASRTGAIERSDLARDRSSADRLWRSTGSTRSFGGDSRIAKESESAADDRVCRNGLSAPQYASHLVEFFATCVGPLPVSFEAALAMAGRSPVGPAGFGHILEE